MQNRASLWQIFSVFAGIGSFTIGGGYAMIPLIEDAMRRRGWIPEDEMSDLVVLAQSAPGLLAVNMAVYSGYRLRGLPGAIAATIGAVLPSFVIILLVAMVFTSIQDNPIVIKIFKGIRPVAVGLILVPAVKMARKGCLRWWQWLLCLATLAAITLLKFSPIYIIAATIAISAGIRLLWETGSRPESGGDETAGLKAPEESAKASNKSAKEAHRRK